MRIIATSVAYPYTNSRGEVSREQPVFKEITQNDMVRAVRRKITVGQRVTASLLTSLNDLVQFLQKPYLGKAVGKIYKRLEAASNELGSFASIIRNMRKNVAQSGIKRKMLATDNAEIRYDPAVHSAALAINNLFLNHGLSNNVDFRMVQKVYFVCSTPGALNSAIEDRLKKKLKTDGIIPKDIINNWKFEYVSKACVGVGQMFERMNSDMNMNGKSMDCALYVVSAINSIHQDEDDLTQIVAYGDESSAGIVVNDFNDSGIVVSELFKFMEDDVDNVIHPFQLSEYPFSQRLKRYFIPPARDPHPRKVAVTISNESPKVLIEMLKDKHVSLFDLKHIIFSQTSKTVLDREEMALIDYYREKELQLPGVLRAELKRYISYEFDCIDFDLKGKFGEISGYFSKIIKESKTMKNRTQELLALRSRLTPKESELLDLVEHLDSAMVRVYDERGYTGASSVTGALGLLVDRGRINLQTDPFALIVSGLGVNIQRMLLNADKVPPRKNNISRDGIPISTNGTRRNGSVSNGFVSKRSLTTN